MHTDSITLSVDGRDYPAELARPEESTDHAVLLLPGANHGPYGDVFDRLADALTDAGGALLRYETWGDDPDLDDLDDKSDAALFAEYEAAVARLRAAGYDHVTVLGKSFGGRIALRHPVAGVDRLVLWAPAAFLAGGEVVETLDHPDDITPPTIEPAALEAHDLRVDILQGDDDAIPVENAHELAERLPEAHVHVVAGADHSFVGGAPEVETVETTVRLLTGAGE